MRVIAYDRFRPGVTLGRGAAFCCEFSLPTREPHSR